MLFCRIMSPCAVFCICLHNLILLLTDLHRSDIIKAIKQKGRYFLNVGEEFNKKLMFDNISYALSILGKRIGELEKETGVSTGYVARASKDENAKPGIDFIVKAADALNMSVDTLLNVDLSGLTETERYLVSFLDKLKSDTNSDKLDWIVKTPHDYNCLEPDINGDVYHPLFSYEEFYEEGETEYPEHVQRVVFISNTHGVHTAINDNCYELRLKNGAMLYLMNIVKSFYYTKDKDKVLAKEVWMSSPNGDKQFLCSTKSHEQLTKLIEGLYSAVKESVRHPRLNKDLKTAIDAFMVDDLEDDDPFEDGTLPF